MSELNTVFVVVTKGYTGYVCAQLTSLDDEAELTNHTVCAEWGPFEEVKDAERIVLAFAARSDIYEARIVERERQESEEQKAFEGA